MLKIKTLGDVTEEVAGSVARAVERTFGEASVDRREPLPGNSWNPYRRQHWAAAVLSQFVKDAPCLLVTDADLYAPGLQSVFGESLLSCAAAVVSTARLRRHGHDQLMERICKSAVHEAGHALGLAHCDAGSCAMRPAASLPELDERTTELCPRCARSRVFPSRSAAPGKGPLQMVYAPGYTMELGSHVFPIRKYVGLERLLRQRGWTDFIEPEPLHREHLERVHASVYLDELEQMHPSPRNALSEVPLSREVLEAQKLAAAGTLHAARDALERGVGVNLGGGLHHAFADRAEGFCYYNDVAVAIRCLQNEGRVQKALVVDCDVHQGNGTARIFQGDSSVFTFSIHQEDLYPVKEESDLDVGLPDHAGDALYHGKLRQVVPTVLEFFSPDVVFYLAGADPYEHDQLGGLDLTIPGLLERDELVLGQCFSRGIPVAIALAGGYAAREADTVTIHYNTCRAAWRLYAGAIPEI